MKKKPCNQNRNVENAVNAIEKANKNNSTPEVKKKANFGSANIYIYMYTVP